MNAKAFHEYLANRTPLFDKLFMCAWREPITPLRRDVRLLPNKKRKLWLQIVGYVKGRKRIPRKTTREINDLMDTALENWLSSLPKRKQKQERAKRASFVGRHEIGKWE